MLGRTVLAVPQSQHMERFLGLNGFDLAVIGAFLGLCALAVAIGQLIRTQRALTAARSAIETTQEGLAMNQLLTVIPQLQRIETELDDAVDDDDKKAARRLLASWRGMATDILGVLVGHPATEAQPASKQTRRYLRLPWRREPSRDNGARIAYPVNQAELEEAIRQSIAQATLAKEGLLDGRSTCKKATESSRKSISAVCESANVFVATLRTYPVRGNHA